MKLMGDFDKARAQRDPLEAIVAGPDRCALAVIIGCDGPAYRPVGAAMAIFDLAVRVGALSSGCIEQDISHHAMDVLDTGTPRILRYGQGSPFMDIQLPCGGGLDIALIPQPNKEVLSQVVANKLRRIPCSLSIDLVSGDMQVLRQGATARTGDVLTLRILPDIRFFIFGKGPEASTFAGLVQSASYPNILLSPDLDTLHDGGVAGCRTRHLTAKQFPNELKVDDRTAITLFFHDHNWEPDILRGALSTSAFYIGAQGSQRARDARLATLKALGVSEHQVQRLYGPIGLIPSARDAQTLAVSVLAEVLKVAGLSKQ